MNLTDFINAKSLDFDCPRHGPYTGIDVPMVAKHYCHRCLADIDALQAKAARDYDGELARFEGWRDRSGIPRRHQNRSIENWEPKSRAQESAKKLITSYADNFAASAERGDGLLFLGPPGTGKTHLMIALATRAWMVGIAARYAVWPEVLDTVKASFNAGPDHLGRHLLDDLRGAPLLVLDELGVRAGSEYDQAALFDLVDYRYREGLTTLAASNATPEDLPKIGERTADRLRECCITVHLPGSSQREHVASIPALRDDKPLISPPETRIVRGEVAVDGKLAPYERVYPRPDPYARRAAA